MNNSDEYWEARRAYEAAEVELEQAEALVAKGINLASVAVMAKAADRKVKARDRYRAVCLGTD